MLEKRVPQRRRDAASLTVSESVGHAAVEALVPEWEALHLASGAPIFRSPDWLVPWTRRIAPQLEPRLVCVRDAAGTLVGLLPLGAETVRPFGRRVRRLTLLGDTHVGSDFLDVLARPADAAAVARVVGLHLRDTVAGWDVLDLPDLEQGSGTPGRLREALGEADFSWEQTPRFTCPWTPLEPQGDFDGFLAKTARRDNFRRRLRWFERQPGFRVEVTREPDGLEPAASAFFMLHRMRWAADGGSQGIRGAGVEAFHREVMARMARRGWLRLSTLWLDDTPLASVYGIAQGGSFVFYQSGYDPSWKARSPGLVLLGLTFRDAFAEGLKTYEFLRGTETYKADWARQTRQTLSLRVIHRHGPGAWLSRSEATSARFRAHARRLLPGAVVEAVRRRRRRASAIDEVAPAYPGGGG